MEQRSASNGNDAEPAPWTGGARVMVCVGYNPVSQRLIQRAGQLARALGGELIALHIQASESEVPGYQMMLEHNMKLARRLGARVLIERGAPVAEVLARVAQANGVTHLVMGESARSRLEEIRRGSLVRQVLRASRGIDVYIVADPA
ncbi:MAG TPA: universal stress protein [Roseiflexaceae bacterium]|nr:universal stress protein [Roseiflexaceae bacterium]